MGTPISHPTSSLRTSHQQQSFSNFVVQNLVYLIFDMRVIFSHLGSIEKQFLMMNNNFRMGGNFVLCFSGGKGGGGDCGVRKNHPRTLLEKLCSVHEKVSVTVSVRIVGLIAAQFGILFLFFFWQKSKIAKV